MTTTPKPLTYQQLNQIEARANAATNGPWDRYGNYGTTFFANTSGPYLLGVGDFNFGQGDQAEADEEFVKHAVEDARALVAEVRRLQQQRRYLIGQLAKKDAASGAGDQALREFLAGADGEQPVAEEQPAEACGKCRQPFDPTDTRFDGRARYHLTPYCRRCVDACHDNEIADHRCVICA